MGLLIKKRFGPRNFVQYLHLKDLYSVGPNPRKKQQVYIKNPHDQGYIIPQSIVNSVLHDRQQSVNVEKQGATKTFANYYGGTGDNRSFVWTAKPQPPVATSMDRLGEDYDRNLGITRRGIQQRANLEASLRGQKEEWLKHWYEHGKKGPKALRWLVQTARENVEADEINEETADDFRIRWLMNKTLPGYMKTWYTKMKNDPAKQVGEIVQRKREMRTNAQIIEAARRAAEESLKRDAKMRRIATQVYAKNYATTMLQLGMERGGGEGGFFPQVGTNLTANVSERRGTIAYGMGSPSEETSEESPWERVAGFGLRQRKGRQSDPTQTRRTLLPQFMPTDFRTFGNA